MSLASIERFKHAGTPMARLLLDRADKANALSVALARSLTEAATELAGDDDLRAVVLTGAGDRVFCAGADVNELAALDSEAARDLITGFHQAIAAVRAIPVPVVARIQGPCIGAGLELVAGADLRLCTASAVFSMPEVRIGIPSVIEAALLPRLMGPARAGWLVLTGDAIDATRAEAWGLVEHVAPDLPALDAAVDGLLDAFAAAGPAAVRTQKRLMRTWEESSLGHSIAESIDAFAAAFEGDEASRLLSQALAARKRG